MQKGALFRILTAPTPTTPSITLPRWKGIEQRTWRPTPTIGQRIRPAGRTEQLHRLDFAARSHHSASSGRCHTHTFYGHLPGHCPLSCVQWTDIRAQTLAQYADGSWKARTLTHHDQYFFTGDSHCGGGLPCSDGIRWGVGTPPHHRTSFRRGGT